MKYKLDKGSHSVYLLQYHFVQVVKYRKKVLKSLKTQDILKTNVINLSDNQNVTVLEIGIDEDHFHLLFRCKPTLNLTQFINSLKTITSREIRRNNPSIKTKLSNDVLWSPSYFLATTGGVTLEMLQDYVAKQGENIKCKKR